VQALAKLTVHVGANIAPGQIVLVNAKLGQEEVVRAVAAACYEAGAHQVEVQYVDPYVQRARLQFAPEEALGTVTPWVRKRPAELAESRGAVIGFSGPSAPGLLDDLDPARIGRDTIALPEWSRVIDEATVNWTIVPGVTGAWANLVYPDLEEPAALDRLWEQISRVCRLDEADPVGAWRARAHELAANAAKLDAAEQFAVLAAQLGVTLPQLAVAFVAAHPAITSVILGPRTMEQLIGLLDGADLELDDTTLDRIDAIVAPGTDLYPADSAWRPPALRDVALRRRPSGERAAA
jgi:leucyl aminopeptidase (aminopeptidase T)